jgi:hypothetical protein
MYSTVLGHFDFGRKYFLSRPEGAVGIIWVYIGICKGMMVP